MERSIKKYSIIVVLLLLAVFLLQKIAWVPSFAGIFKEKPIVIDSTPVLIKQINNLSQLITISMYDEVVMASSKPKNLPSFPGLRPVPDKIVLIGKGKVLAGLDLNKITKYNVYVFEDSVSILLPPAEIFSTIVNPSDFETFDETGNWSPNEITKIKVRIRDQITARALQNKILPRAYQRGTLVLENFLRGVGFKKINLRPG